MAKVKKRKLRWKASDSSQVIGYKLYWSEGAVPGYDSSCKMLGNVTEVILPDDVASFNPKPGPVTFGITAVDELGNESDMVTLAAPYQFCVPKAPGDLHMQTINDFYTSDVQQNKSSGDNKADHDNPVEPENIITQINSAQHSTRPDLSKTLKLIEKQALAF